MAYDISVIIPIYNVERYLRRALDSLLSQTHHSWEAILIDDGSPDACGDIADAYAARDGRFKVIHQANRGVSASRNTGMERAAGRYVLFLDPDDNPSDRFAAQHDPIGLAAVDGGFDGLAGDDLAVFLEMAVPPAELFQRAVIEGFLIVPDEPLAVVRRQGDKGNINHCITSLNRRPLATAVGGDRRPFSADGMSAVIFRAFPIPESADTQHKAPE